jgi:hypothetical protein
MQCAQCTRPLTATDGGFSEDGRRICQSCVAGQTIAAGDREVQLQKDNLEKVARIDRVIKLVQSFGAVLVVVGMLHVPRWPWLISAGMAVTFGGGIFRQVIRSSPS